MNNIPWYFMGHWVFNLTTKILVECLGANTGAIRVEEEIAYACTREHKDKIYILVFSTLILNQPSPVGRRVFFFKFLSNLDREFSYKNMLEKVDFLGFNFDNASLNQTWFRHQNLKVCFKASLRIYTKCFKAHSN